LSLLKVSKIIQNKKERDPGRNMTSNMMALQSIL